MIRATKKTLKAGGEDRVDAEKRCAACRQIAALYRPYVFARKCLFQLENRTRAFVASALGYRGSADDEKERARMVATAAAVIKAIENGTAVPEGTEHVVPLVVDAVLAARESKEMTWKRLMDASEKKMEKLAKSLPVAAWVQQQRGVGIGNLARIIGECGDLSNYANPAKVWRRMGLAPHNGRMPATWRSKGGLSAEAWTEIGYCPRRRSVMWNVGACMLKANDGDYRKIYDEQKARFKAKHECSDGHAHNHGMLMMEKELLKRLWCAWNGKPVHGKGDNPNGNDRCSANAEGRASQSLMPKSSMPGRKTKALGNVGDADPTIRSRRRGESNPDIERGNATAKTKKRRRSQS